MNFNYLVSWIIFHLFIVSLIGSIICFFYYKWANIDQRSDHIITKLGLQLFICFVTGMFSFVCFVNPMDVLFVNLTKKSKIQLAEPNHDYLIAKFNSRFYYSYDENIVKTFKESPEKVTFNYAVPLTTVYSTYKTPKFKFNNQ